ncbi:MAG: hypothetical protein RSH78_03625 [Bacilli bacterium]
MEKFLNSYAFHDYLDLLVFVIQSSENKNMDGKLIAVQKNETYNYHWKALDYIYNKRIKHWYNPKIEGSDVYNYLMALIKTNNIIFLNTSSKNPFKEDHLLRGTLFIPEVITKKQYESLNYYKEELKRTEMNVNIYNENYNITENKNEDGEIIFPLDITKYYEENEDNYSFTSFKKAKSLSR